MSLLWMEYETAFQNLVDTSFQLEEEDNPEYFSKLPNRVKKIIYRDTRYNVDFLYTSYILNDDKIMEDYARWLLKLMDSVLTDKTTAQTIKYVHNHLEYIRKGVLQTVDSEKHEKLMHLLDCAQAALQLQSGAGESEQSEHSKYEAEIQQYLESLLQKNSRKTLYLIHQFIENGIPLNDIYVEILAESMRRIGDMWHTAKITVDTEHYCTSITQMAMSQMYPIVFSEKRKNRMVLCACPGTELHEIGARMVADLFENDGWDSLYLGAAVPEDAMLESIRTNKPDLIALSVTMPQHLIDCQDLITAIRKEFPDAKIAVGGHAFLSTHHIWSKWPIDIYTTDARELLKQANALIESR